jgi:tetratricopeptide (TPR) repeat protein
MANDQKAIEYLKKPIEYFKTTENYFYLTNAKVNLALLLKKEKSPEEVILLLKETLKYATISENTSAKGTIYDVLASLYLKEKKIDIAIDYARKSIQIREEQGAESEIQESEITYADCLVAKGNYQEAKKFYLKIKNRFEKIAVKDNLLQVYLGLSYVYSNQNNSDSLFFYQRNAIYRHFAVNNSA